MNEDLKIDIYQRVVKNIRDAEKEAVKKTFAFSMLRSLKTE